MAIRDKTTTNKWTYEKSHKLLNSYSLVKYNKIYPNTNSWKILQEESLWWVDFDNLYFWNTLNKTNHGILVWNRNIRLYTLYKKHVYKVRKETTHEEIGERTVITTSNVYISTSTRFAITKWSQDLRYINNVSKIEEKKKIHKVLTTFLNVNTPPKDLSLSLDALGRGEGDSTKPPRQACRLAIQPTWVFTWHKSSLRVSRQASMR